MIGLFVNFKFDAAHRLMTYHGACHNLHGHTWKLRIHVSGAVDPDTGMIVDFKILKSIVDSVLDDFDHHTLLNIQDIELSRDLESRGTEVTHLMRDPTCEFLAEELFRMIDISLKHADLEPPVHLVSVQVWESEDASALYQP